MKKAVNKLIFLGGLVFFAILSIGFVRNTFEIKLKKHTTLTQTEVKSEITDEEASGNVIELSTGYDGYEKTNSARGRKGGVSSYEEVDVERLAVDPKPIDEKIMRVNNFLNEFAEIAQEQALESGVPAGISLAVGIEKINSGASISSPKDFMRKVIKPLTKVKSKAPEDMQKKYFKYYANSQRWAEGLEHTSILKSNLDEYRLDAFDRVVNERIIARKNSYVAVKNEDRRTGKVTYEAVSSAVEVPEESYEESYDRIVGREVALKIAEKERKKNGYLTVEDLDRINAKTEKALGPKLHFVGRGEPDPNSTAADITHPDGFQARGKIWERRKGKSKISKR